jgi:hypothetical protein
MSATEFGSVAQWVAAGVAITAAVVAWRALLTSREALRVTSRTFARTALHEVVLKSFTERPFVDGTGDRKVPLYDRPVVNLRYAKTAARDLMKNAPERWVAHSDISRRDRWENSVAFETADALTQFGFAVFTGMIPLNEAMANVADVVVDDWMICHAWVKSYHRQERVKKNVGNEDVDYHRRHAEWIFLVARLWLDRNRWHYPDLYALKDRLPDAATARRRLELINEADMSIIPPDVRREVDMLLGKPASKLSTLRHWLHGV